MRIIMHGHHANTLLSFLPSLEDRIANIKRNKPAHEQAMRLYLIQDVTDLLPRTKAWAAYDKARAAYAKAQAAYDKARAAYDKAAAAYTKAAVAYWASFDVEAFHREHCRPDCPWDGQTIFPAA